MATFRKGIIIYDTVNPSKVGVDETLITCERLKKNDFSSEELIEVLQALDNFSLTKQNLEGICKVIDSVSVMDGQILLYIRSDRIFRVEEGVQNKNAEEKSLVEEFDLKL